MFSVQRNFSDSLKKFLLAPLAQLNKSTKETTKETLNDTEMLPKWLQEGIFKKMNITQLTSQQLKLHTFITYKSVGKQQQSLPPPPPLLLVKGAPGQGKSIGFLISSLSTILNPRIMTSPSRLRNKNDDHHHHHHDNTKTTKANPIAPKILILTPTIILQEQLYKWTLDILSTNQFLDSKIDSVIQKTPNPPGGTPHLLISTPKDALSLFSDGTLVMDNLVLLIMDEVDSLLGIKEGIEVAKPKKKAIQHFHVKPALALYRQIIKHEMVRVIACSATLPCTPLLATLSVGPKRHTLIDFTTKESDVVIVKHLYRKVSNEREIYSLINSIHLERCLKVGKGIILLPKEFSKISFISSMKECYPSLNIGLLSSSSSDDDDNNLLIASETDCRGLDLPLLQYIIIIDLPLHGAGIEWYHMIGRLGRLGQIGTHNEIISIVKGDLQLERLMNLYERYSTDTSSLAPSLYRPSATIL